MNDLWASEATVSELAEALCCAASRLTDPSGLCAGVMVVPSPRIYKFAADMIASAVRRPIDYPQPKELRR